jgi:hypothetical protein
MINTVTEPLKQNKRRQIPWNCCFDYTVAGLSPFAGQNAGLRVHNGQLQDLWHWPELSLLRIAGIDIDAQRYDVVTPRPRIRIC